MWVFSAFQQTPRCGVTRGYCVHVQEYQLKAIKIYYRPVSLRTAPRQ